jgi:sulfite dehydrogenase (quinone) subunit SoeC
MHPAASVIFFTTASGAGYGLLALLAGFALAGGVPPDRWLGFVGLGLAVGLISAGLLSSTFHLGRPERAWRAFSQWRSSWLSREGVAAVATYFPTALLALGWIVFARADGVYALAAAFVVVMAVVTVVCTGMIYASLKPIRQWHTPWTTPVYLALGAYTGSLLLVALALAFGVFRPVMAEGALALLILAAVVKMGYWRAVDTEPPRSTLATATGLTNFSSVRLFEAPHTEENFVMREMGFQIARKHAHKLRNVVALALFLVPFVLLVVALVADAPHIFIALAAALIAVASAGVGVATERWLFFAEATHASMLYYSRAA